MPAPYPTLNATDTTNLYVLTKYLNGIAPLMAIVLGVVWIVSFIGSISEGRPASRAFIFASFICAVLSILATLIGMLNKEFMYFSFILVGVGIIWYYLSNSPGM